MNTFFKSQLMMLTISWFAVFIYILLGGGLYSKTFSLFTILYMWIPGLVALYYYKLEKLRLPVHFKWNPNLIWASLLSLGLVAFTVLLSLPFSEMRSIESLKKILPSFLTHFTLPTMIFLFVVMGVLISLLMGYTLYFIICLGGEMMWRGYMWDKLKFLGFWKASCITGISWGIWQAPLILMGCEYPDAPFLGIVWSIIRGILMSPIILYTRLQCKSVLGPAVSHGVFNAVIGISVYIFVTQNNLIVGLEGVTGFIACIVFDLLIWIKIKNNPLLEYEI